MKKIRFYVKQYQESPPAYIKYPSLVLVPNTWNDYGYAITFKLFYYETILDRTEIGDVKILDRRYDETDLPNQFLSVGENRCSLGQSLDYYEKIKKLFPEEHSDIFHALNDVAINTEIRKRFEDLDGYHKALLRFTAAEKAFQEARHLLGYERIRNSSFQFSYSVQLKGATTPHVATFAFIRNRNLPFRINVIIGKNGTGKTQFLASMINTVSGLDNSKGFFNPFKPLFSTFIAISYSIFDKFPSPGQSSKLSYRYIGLRSSEDDIIDDEKIARKLRQALRDIREQGRQEKWFEFLSYFISLDDIRDSYAELTDSTIEKLISEKIGTQSSGQNTMIFIFTELLSKIRRESLVLFDEPETHLHPSAITLVMKCLHDILKFYNSYAIIATHSAQILQDVPAKCVSVFDREGNVPIVRRLPIESFGENVSALTNTVFETLAVGELYKEYLDALSQKMTLEEINNLFDGRLSLNAQLYLAAISQEQ